jgi:mannose-6-phosphate isomerase
MSGLYPLKFEPICLEKIWGGNRLKTLLGKKYNSKNCGESWEISGVEGNISVVANGFLKGNDLSELIEIYMGELVGDKVYEQFGAEFPLLIKFIDAQDDLSIQVHPNDELSKERHNAFGKTEMWYVVDVAEGALINSGFNQPVDREKYIEYLENGNLTDLLKYDEVKDRRCFFYSSRPGSCNWERIPGSRDSADLGCYLPHFRLQPKGRQRESSGTAYRSCFGCHRLFVSR